MTAIVAIATKESKEQKCGISLTNQYPGKGPGPVLITNIEEDGLFASSALVIGMEVKTINNQPVTTSSEAIAVLKEAEGQVTIVADVATPEEKTSASANPTATGHAPPGVGEGGQWGKNNYVGEKTQAAACVGCLCCCLPGLCILLCPFDERDTYKHEDKVYDASGHVIGLAGNTKFVPVANKMIR